MEPESILKDMALYDFKAPINILFYEENSDDEKRSENAIVTENNANSTNNNIIIKSNSQEEKNEKSGDVTLVIPTSPEVCECYVEDKHSKECIQNKSENHNNFGNHSKIDRGKRKCYDLFYEDEVIKQKIKIQVLDDISKTPQHKNISSNSGYPALLQDNDDKIKDPLEAISHFLIVIAESYNYHISISNKKTTKKCIAVSKKHYLDIKYHFFKTAYEIVHTSIIPKENDCNFVNSFLNSTIKMANNKTKVDSSKIIKILYTELIKWVKRKKRNESKLKKSNDKNPNNDFSEKLSQPSILNSNNKATENQHDHNNKSNIGTFTNSKNQSQTLPTCTFTPELTGEEISINFNTALSNNQNDKTIINNDISYDENIRSQNPLSTLQLFHYLQNCNNNRPLNNDLVNTDIHTDAIPFVNNDNVESNAKKITHNQTMNKINKLPNKQNVKTVNDNGITDDKNRNQNTLLLNFLQNSNGNRLLNAIRETEDVHPDTMLLINNNNMQPNTNEISDNQTMHKEITLSNKQNNKAKINNDITSHINIRSQNPLPDTQFLNYLQNCNDNRSFNNRLATTDIRTDTISLVDNSDHNIVHPNTNEMALNENINNISYQQIASTGATTLQYGHNSSILSYHYQNAKKANNTAFDPNQKRVVNLNIVNSSPHPMSLLIPKNINILPNQDLNTFHQSHNLNYTQGSTDIHPNTVPHVTPSQTISDTTYQQIPSTPTTVMHSPYYNKSIPVSSSPPHCFQNTIHHRMDSNHKRINNSSGNHSNNIHISQHYTMNVLPNQGLNSHHSRPGNGFSDSNRILNHVGPDPPVYNSTHYLPVQNRNYHLSNFGNRNSASLPQYFPSNVNRPISSSVVDQSHVNILENRLLNSVQNQELTVHPPPPYREPIRQDQARLAHVNSPSGIQYNVQPEPHRSRSSVSTDSGFASPVASDDNYNNMEAIMNGLFELQGPEATDTTADLPVITHVTSLNTKVAFVKEGSCYICGKISKEMCSGCYKVYYCSPNCQASDWRLHKYSCEQNKTT